MGGGAWLLAAALLLPGEASACGTPPVKVGEISVLGQLSPNRGCELFKKASGTPRLLVDIKPGFGSSEPKELTAFRGLVYFSADDGKIGRELWRTDGTAEGTTVIEIFPGISGSFPEQLEVVGDTLFFSAQGASIGRELYKLTADKPELVVDIRPGKPGATPSELTERGGTLYFFANDGKHGYELFQSDGTPAGTRMLRDIRKGPGKGSEPFGLLSTDLGLFFTADDGETGRELWRSDGSEAGTLRVFDIDPGRGSGAPQNLTPSGKLIYFTARDRDHGLEPWLTDGTAEGTRLIKDLEPGKEGSTPTNLSPQSPGLVFRACVAKQCKLWQSDGTAANTKLFGATKKAAAPDAEAEPAKSEKPGAP